MVVDIKKAQERLNALYKDYDYTDKKNDDVRLLHGERLSYIQKDRYKTMSEEKKSSLQHNISNGWAEKQGTLSVKQQIQLVIDYWSCSKSPHDVKRLCKKYGLKESALKSSATQSKYIGDTEYKKLQKNWQEKYGFKVEVRSPGNDLLDFYDKQNAIRGERQRLKIPPSIIYNIRFSESYLSTKDIYHICKPYYDNGAVTDSDWSYYKNMRKNRLAWLVDTPSIKKICHSEKEINEFVSQSIKQEIDCHNVLNGNVGLGWHGKLGGWSFIKLHNERN